MIYAEILAGGVGRRMGNTPMPKQFLMLGSRPIIIHTLEKFILNNRFEKIFVNVPKDWMNYTTDIIEKYIGENERVIVLEGGADRNETLLAGPRFIEANYGLNDDDVIITHDAVRPFISHRIIEDNIDAVLKFAGVDTVVPAFDTIVKSEDGELITEIPIRDFMYQGQTPQSFNCKVLMECYDQLSEDERNILSDSCKILVLAGRQVKLVAGEVFNTKITTQYDLKVAESMLGEEKL